ncbi:hypothetical protein [Pyrodictium delaneyi]|uniref:hypothetical protein n=1 Tax=Pyrodictium delaneyi TaxID=1273541 RepID=UPI00117B0189|nr:hypothetical protein [Pyrodictium delaneyi]
MPVVFRPLEGKTSRRAARYDIVLIVAAIVDSIERKEAYRSLGIQLVEIYPLLPNDSPTLFSLLGIIGWIKKYAESFNVLVEGYGGEKLLREAYRIVKGSWSWNSIIRVANELQSPLHLRSLVHIAKLAEAGIDLREEVEKHLEAAFTGGDAYRSSLLEHSIDIVLQLSIGDECIREVYEYIGSRRNEPRRSLCRAIVEVARKLDYMKAGAVKTIAVDTGSESKAKVYLGCRLLLRDDECWPEARSVEKPLEELLKGLGYGLAGLELVDPEEAACIAYGVAYGYECDA